MNRIDLKTYIALLAFIIIMIFPLVYSSPVNAYHNLDDVIGEIKFGETKEVDGLSIESARYLKFVPDKDEFYKFYSDADDPVSLRICVYKDGYMNGLTYGYSKSASARLSAGETYYLEIIIREGDYSIPKPIKIHTSLKCYDITSYYFLNDEQYYVNGQGYFPNLKIRSSEISAGHPTELTYGKECKIMGFCTHDMYSNHLIGDIDKTSIKWSSEIPKENGRYYVWIKGIAPYYGDKYELFWVKNSINSSYINSQDLKSSENEVSLENKKAKYFIIRPEKTGDYYISVGLKDKNFYNTHGYTYSVSWNLYGSNGEVIYGFEPHLIGGEEYYLRVVCKDNSTSFHGYDGDLPDIKSSVDFIISIEGYVYKPLPELSQNFGTNNPATEETSPGINNPSDSSNKASVEEATIIALKKGKTFTVDKIKYKVSVSKKGNYQVSVLKNQNKKMKKINIPDSISYKGVTYKVTSVAAKAFSGNSKATSITIGSNIKTIGKNAFDGCKKIKKVIVKSKVIKSVGKNAFKNVPKNAAFSVPKSVLKKYKKLFKNYKLKVLPEFKTASSDSKVLGALFDDEYKLNCVDYLLYKGIPLSVNDLSLSVFDQYTARTFTTNAIYLFSTYNETSKTYGDYIDTFAGTPGKYRVKAVKDVSGEYEFGDTATYDFTVYDVSDISELKSDSSYKSIYYWGNPISEKDLDFKLTFTFEDKNAGLSLSIEPDITFEYAPLDKDKNEYINYKNGLPSTGGKYRIKASGRSPYKGECYYNIEIINGLDISSGCYKIKDHKDYTPNLYDYTGKPLDPSKICLLCDYYEKHDKYDGYTRYLKYGTDYEVTGYIPAVPEIYKYDYKGYYNDSSYKISSLFRGFSFRKGTPTDRGSYVVRVEGKGKYKGIIYVLVNIYSRFNPEYISVKANISKNEQDIEIDPLVRNFYMIKPYETGSYIIFSTYNNKYRFNVFLYDKNGCPVPSIKGKEASINGFVYSNLYGFSYFAELKGGETYYLEIDFDDYGDYHDKNGHGYYFNNTTYAIPLYIEGIDCSYLKPSKQKSTERKDDIIPGSNKAKPLAKGKIITLGDVKYKVTLSDKKNATVSLYKNSNKNIKNINIPSSIKYKGIKYKVTSISAKAFAGNKKLNNIIIPSTIKSIGKNAFKGIKSNAVIKVPKKKLTFYKKLLKKAKIAKTIKVKSK